MILKKKKFQTYLRSDNMFFSREKPITNLLTPHFATINSTFLHFSA